MGELTAHLDVPLDLSAPAAARVAVTAMLAIWHLDDPDWLDDAVLVVSELVTNAVRHGGGCLALELQLHERHVTVAVADGSAVVPRRRDPADSDGGRGLAIIETLSVRWGVQPHEGGKRVWVLLRPYPSEGLGG